MPDAEQRLLVRKALADHAGLFVVSDVAIDAIMTASQDTSYAADIVAAERALERMGWPEIHAFQSGYGQAACEDAGGFMLRRLKALFGIGLDPVRPYKEGARAMVAKAKDQLTAP